jgi:hypothetical protein
MPARKAGRESYAVPFRRSRHCVAGICCFPDFLGTANRYSNGTITYQDGSKEVHIGEVDNQPLIDGTQYRTFLNGLETEVDYYDTDGATLLKKVVTPYTHRPCTSTPEVCWFDVTNTMSPSHDPRISMQ